MLVPEIKVSKFWLQSLRASRFIQFRAGLLGFRAYIGFWGLGFRVQGLLWGDGLWRIFGGGLGRGAKIHQTQNLFQRLLPGFCLVCIYICMYIYIHIWLYIYVYIERERGREIQIDR